MRRNRQAGFTILELLVAISVAVLTTAVAIPIASETLARYRLNGNANIVGFEIARARLQAIARSRYVRVQNYGTTVICRQESSDNILWEPSSCLSGGHITSLSGGLTLTGSGPVFDRTGLLYGGGTNVMTLTNSIGTKSITTNILGRVSIS